MTIQYKSIFQIGVLLVSLLFFPQCAKNSEPPVTPGNHAHGIIPLPLSVDLATGHLSIDSKTILVNFAVFEPAVAAVDAALVQALKVPGKRNDKPSGVTNIQFLEDKTIEPEGYQIDISASGIMIKASDAAGAFYAAQSIRQMIWNSTAGLQAESVSLLCMTIKDKPKYSWRGFHLDVSRHFFTKEYVLKIIDWLSYYKLNKLHLHLTDDQGWRLESEKFPQLNEIGSWRTFNSMDSTCIELAKKDITYTLDERFIREVNGNKVYGGFYTKQDIREIIAYATSKFIEVIPEVDMPGHMSAAIRAYPWLSCADSAGWGKEFSFPVCPCKNEVMEFCYQVWDEIADLFPSKYMHIGCDEVEKGTWAKSADCQGFMKNNGIKDLNGIQNFFVRKMQEHLEARGKKVIAWDDVIDGSIDSNITMMFWRDWVKDSPARSAANGNAIILAPWSPFYLASVNTDDALQKLFEYSPSTIYPPEVLDKVLGLQTCMWTEVVPSEAVFENLAFPRMQALAEISWSPARNWYSFQVRMKPHFNLMNLKNVHYRRPGWLN